MDHVSISESILRSLEAREKRRGGKPERKEDAAPRGPSTEDILLAACAKELERTVRDSVRTSFAHWEAGLVREVEGIARRVSRSRESGVAFESHVEAPARAPASEPPAGQRAVTASHAMAGARADGPAPLPAATAHRSDPRQGGGPPGEESWDDLVEAVKELRREWDQDTFEKCFGDDSVPAEFAPQAEPSAPPPAPPRREPSPLSREREALTFREATTSGAGARGVHAEPMPREALGKKLDELIHLVKSSQPQGTKPPAVSREVSSDIAREVVGRLKDTLATMARSPASAAEKAPPPPQEARIPLDDISAMIDQITGSARP